MGMGTPMEGGVQHPDSVLPATPMASWGPARACRDTEASLWALLPERTGAEVLSNASEMPLPGGSRAQRGGPREGCRSLASRAVVWRLVSGAVAPRRPRGDGVGPGSCLWGCSRSPRAEWVAVPSEKAGRRRPASVSRLLLHSGLSEYVWGR